MTLAIQPKEISREIYMKDPCDLYTSEFFSGRRHRKRMYREKSMGKCIVECLDAKSVIDYGCGLGLLLEGVLESGVKNILGIEYSYKSASPFISKHMQSYIRFGNVMEKCDCGKFDCVVSIEVAEHILEEKSDVFVDNLVDSSNMYVILTAAPPGQGGIGHINEQKKQFWIDKIEKKGFKNSTDVLGKFRAKLAEEKVKLPVFVKRNMMIFKRDIQL